LASRTSDIQRSAAVMPRSLVEANGMLSWRGIAEGSIEVDGLFTLLLLDDY
jgi:hypothetical protein